MKIGDNVKILLSCGIVEEGIIVSTDYIAEFDNDSYIILMHKNNNTKKLNIKKEHISAYQIENSVVDEKELKTLIVDDLSLSEPIANPKLRIKKLAQLRINKSNDQKRIFKKVIESPIINEKIDNIKYNLPSFLKK